MSRTDQLERAAYAALLESAGGRLVVVAGGWSHPGEVTAWASSLVNQAAPMQLRAVVPLFTDLADAALVLAAVEQGMTR